MAADGKIEIALRYEQVIAEQMKKRMSDGGNIGMSNRYDKGGSIGHTLEQPSTKRKELSTIAGTSEGSMQRTKLILKKSRL